MPALVFLVPETVACLCRLQMAALAIDCQAPLVVSHETCSFLEVVVLAVDCRARFAVEALEAAVYLEICSFLQHLEEEDHSEVLEQLAFLHLDVACPGQDLHQEMACPGQEVAGQVVVVSARSDHCTQGFRHPCW